MSKGEGERSWTSDHLASFIILRSVAWAHKLVISLAPRDDASEMSAHGIESIGLQLGAFDNEVVRIAFEALDQVSIAVRMVG